MATTSMASAVFSFGSRICTPQAAIRPASVQFPPFAKKQSCLNLSSSSSQFIAPLVLGKNLSVATPMNGKSRPVTVFCAKGYKMKTHKASAKRFRVTGTGKIIRRRAGKQHLLHKKNTKRRNRLSKTVQVNRSDYNNVIGALPYLKVNRAN